MEEGWGDALLKPEGFISLLLIAVFLFELGFVLIEYLFLGAKWLGKKMKSWLVGWAER